MAEKKIELLEAKKVKDSMKEKNNSNRDVGRGFWEINSVVQKIRIPEKKSIAKKTISRLTERLEDLENVVTKLGFIYFLCEGSEVEICEKRNNPSEVNELFKFSLPSLYLKANLSRKYTMYF